ncbi:serine hydrolase [Aeromicrobium sp. UC242_57]|uniref:serine hydrolase n=1 Tax=Aeromicrobium sp. UC242_57 TaxID=3374624 RepID=UPI0037AB7DA1
MMTWTFKTWLTSAVLTGTLIGGAALATAQDSSAGVSTVAVAPLTPVSQTTTTAEEPTTVALEAISTDARYSVSVLDLDSGAALTYGGGEFDTASIVKVDILAALLHGHQQAGTEMSDSERAQAAAMIERSDNAAATALFEAVGGKEGLDAFNQLIGLDDTEVGANGSWGLTQTTSDDQIALLQVVFGSGSVLTASAQEYVADLMSNVVEAQNFGVSAAADDSGDAALKVGFLQRSTTGAWDVTSIGRIEAAGRTYLVAVLSDGNTRRGGGSPWSTRWPRRRSTG